MNLTILPLYPFVKSVILNLYILFNFITQNPIFNEINQNTFDTTFNKTEIYTISYNYIKKVDHKISIPIKGKNAISLNDSYQKSDNINQVSYTYKGYIRKLNIHILKVQRYETGEYLLINSITGNTLSTWGMPIISPDGKLVCSFSSSLDYDIMPNGIQVFNIQNNNFKKLIEYETDRWAPQAIKWANSQCIYVKSILPNQSSNTKTSTIKYFKVTLQP